MPDSEVTAYRLNLIDERLKEIGAKLDNLSFVPRETFTIEMRSVAKRFDALEERLVEMETGGKDRYRIMIGGLLTLTVALMSTIIALALV